MYRDGSKRGEIGDKGEDGEEEGSGIESLSLDLRRGGEGGGVGGSSTLSMNVGNTNGSQLLESIGGRHSVTLSERSRVIEVEERGREIRIETDWIGPGAGRRMRGFKEEEVIGVDMRVRR